MDAPVPPPRLKERVVKRPLRHLCLSIVLPVLFAATCACTTAAAGTATVASAVAPRSASPDAALQAFAEAIGVTCEHKDGRLACIGGKPEVGDYADVELHPDCGPDGWFGVIAANDPVALRNRISPLDTQTIATLSRGQTVCIRAIGQVKDRPFYYFATAIPRIDVPACSADHACSSAAPPAIDWSSKKPLGSCDTGTQRSLRNCASGWIQAGQLSRLPTPPQTR
jgi:hypothetical protein